ncbi:sodium-coupled monocarboxylate transporter 2-like [Physella acuta]|uniref:sodium-coupled monocarboxylate transporter 2-like n=1 Tax=Physella acuta TaxID=109671 RepID=UPI0027DE4F4E|nr:sodium-coupled monocarboxylate transporter 2-like [Physella acuta]XP_059148706.1 sodium-coupled monocarboxylate transporter 2-like [Physella acuta]XP_059148707.1 sodium-coupled monocarboxylate transporter 2-like [Physella acuta]
MDANTTIQVADYVVCVVVLLIPTAIGILFAVKDAKKATREEYLFGGRQMSVVPVALSLFVTFMSAISLMGNSTDMYTYSVMVMTIYIGLSLSYVVGLFTIVPLFYSLQLTSIYEYFELRFHSRAVRMSALAVGMLQTICYMAVALYSPALGLQTTANIPLWMSIVIVGIIGTVYSALGGIKSVVWADAFQCFVMFGGALPIIIVGIKTAGGWSEAWPLAVKGGRVSFDVFDPDPRVRHTWWGSIFGAIFMWLSSTFSQSTIQRLCAMKTMRDAKISFILNIPIMLAYGVLLFFVGFAVYVYFEFLRCDPYEGGLISNRNQITPFLVMHALKDMPGLAGLFMGTLFSGSLSTISSGISALAANTVEDILRKSIGGFQESRITFFTKVIVCLYGLVIVGLAYVADSIDGPVTQMSSSVFGACGGPVFGVFILGACIPWSNKYGALGGGGLALVFNVWLAISGQMYGRKTRPLQPPSIENCYTNGSMLLQNATFTFVNLTLTTPAVQPISNKDPYSYGFFLYDISYIWYGFIGCFVAFISGALISFCFKNYDHTKTDPRLIIPILRKLWSLPEPEHKQHRQDSSTINSRSDLSSFAKELEISLNDFGLINNGQKLK